jgi:hypothetical protein
LEGVTVNKKRYKKVLTHLQEVFNLMYPETWVSKDWVPHMTVPQHIGHCSEQQEITKNGAVMLPYSLCSPNLAPYRSYVFCR